MRDDVVVRFMWFSAGVALGAAATALLTPYSGPQARRLLTEKADEGRRVVAESGREWVEKGHEWYEMGRKVADDAAEMYADGRRLVEG
ncbi:MAG TPA: hypothetical protein VE621_11220 [Bryobacteraceae bacterium]|jgi:gas vesicle protein|nr:hypothetical protein [Bryobacteraceae bacterium]